MKSKKAFTLIELSIVLVVIGLLIGSSTKVFISMSKSSKIREAKSQLQVFMQDIEGFTLVHHRLPFAKEFENFSVKNSDPWGKKIIYLPSNILQKDVCQKKTGLRQKHNDKTIHDIAFILLSSGPNRNLQSKLEADSVQTITYGAESDLESQPVDRIEPFDDIYVSKTLWSLYVQNDCLKGITK